MTPPSVFGSLKALDDKLFFERPSVVSRACGNSCPTFTNSNESIKISNSGSSNVLPTCVEQSGEEDHEPKNDMTPIITTTTPSPMPSRKSSLKIKRSSSKHKKIAMKIDDDKTEILNNGKSLQQTQSGDEIPSYESLNIRKSSIQSDKDVLLSKTNCIRNDTQNTRSPRANVRRSSSIKSEATHQMPLHNQQQYLSNKYINNNQYFNMNRKNSINIAQLQHPHYFHQQYHQRRMSSIEQTFEKQSNVNLNNFETYMQQNIKVDLQKSISSINNPNPQPDSIPVTENCCESGGSKLGRFIKKITGTQHWTEQRESYSLYIFTEQNTFRKMCSWFVNQKWFDNVVLFFIALNCITLAMERPNIPPTSHERVFLGTANYVFTVVFAIEMFIKVIDAGMFYGTEAYFTSGWNIMDGSLVIISIIDLLMSLISESSPRIFGILRVFRLLRSLRPLRVINRAPGLKLVVQTLLSSLRPIGNIVLICCTFFIIFGILGVQLFKGTFFYCEGENIKGVKNRTDCLSYPGNVWINRKYNFDDLGKALMSLFVLSSRDGWVNIMYTGLDAVGVDQQVIFKSDINFKISLIKM